ncbi:Coenzyme F420 hydrogenase/dehydrogenase, beta subunit N-term [Lachnospiraceae bacterium NLAE-zl-G231]|nr:Coenzyme F420 hydrogenase/dehydrogenase, beta subunit N-term [Lachnospiraceae bacterium NLAE-zl-G231]
MVEIIEKQYCSGCTACASICPKCCIQMKADSEGFLYPSVEKSNCVDCGACERVCPIKNLVPEKLAEQKAYLVQYRDEAIRLDSSAGGAFTAIAETVLGKGGVVFGAAYDENFQVHHVFVERREELGKFRNSKYVQSDMGKCFQKAKDFLKEGRWVCFSGTPCQIEGLSKYLGKLYEKLVLVDVVCHGIPSPLIWNKYLEYKYIAVQKPDNIRFRDKFYGYKYSTMSWIYKGKNVYHAGSHLDPMLRAFFSDICDRPSCYNCPFKKRYRISDMTIWDCFSVYSFDRSMDDDKGTTRVLCHTQKAVEIMKEGVETIKCKEVAADSLVKGVKEMFESVKMNPKRTQFFADAQKLTGTELFEKYYPVTTKIKMKTMFRKVLCVTGSYGAIKKCLNKLRGR